MVRQSKPAGHSTEQTFVQMNPSWPSMQSSSRQSALALHEHANVLQSGFVSVAVSVALSVATSPSPGSVPSPTPVSLSTLVSGGKKTSPAVSTAVSSIFVPPLSPPEHAEATTTNRTGTMYRVTLGHP